MWSNTIRGAQFLDSTVPRLIRAIEELTETLKESQVKEDEDEITRRVLHAALDACGGRSTDIAGMIDDLTVLHQLEKVGNADIFIYKPSLAYRMPGYQSKNVKGAGMNHPGGVTIHYYLKNEDKLEEKYDANHPKTPAQKREKYSKKNKISYYK